MLLDCSGPQLDMFQCQDEEPGWWTAHYLRNKLTKRKPNVALHPQRQTATLHSPLRQSLCITVIYSSDPKISRCYNSDILHVMKCVVGEHLQEPRTARTVRTVRTELCWWLEPRLVFLRADGCEAVAASLACQPRGASPSFAVLCVISIAAVLLSFSAEETWQLPPRSTRPVSERPVRMDAMFPVVVENIEYRRQGRRRRRRRSSWFCSGCC